MCLCFGPVVLGDLTQLRFACSEKSDAFVVKNFDVDWLNRISNEVVEAVRRDPNYQPEWKEIPAGDAVERDQTCHHITSMPMPYRQGTQPLCVLRSFTSTLELYGDSFAHWGDTLDSLASAFMSMTLSLGTSRCPRMELLFNTVRNSSKLKWDASWLPRFQIAHGPDHSSKSSSVVAALLQRLDSPNCFLLVRLEGVDKSTTHCVCIARSMADDSLVSSTPTQHYAPTQH